MMVVGVASLSYRTMKHRVKVGRALTLVKSAGVLRLLVCLCLILLTAPHCFGAVSTPHQRGVVSEGAPLEIPLREGVTQSRLCGAESTPDGTVAPTGPVDCADALSSTTESPSSGTLEGEVSCL